MASYPWFTNYNISYAGIHGIPVDSHANLESNFDDDHQAWYVVRIIIDPPQVLSQTSFDDDISSHLKGDVDA